LQGKGINWSPSGEYATVIAADGFIRIWDTVEGLELQRLTFFGAESGQAIWSPAEDYIYAAGDMSNEFRVFKLSAALASVPAQRGLVGAMSWSPDGRQVSRGYADGTVIIWDIDTWSEVMSLDGGTDYVCGAAWSPSGDRILTNNDDGTVRIWDAGTGELLLEFSSLEGQVFSAAWSPDGSRIAHTESMADMVSLRAADTGEVIWSQSQSQAAIVAWSPDGTRLATTGVGIGSIRDAATGEVLLSLFPEDHPNWVEGAAWSHDGKRIVIFSDGKGWIFDTTTGEQLIELSSGFTSSVWNVLWSLGDERIFATGGDGTYRVFEAATGIELLVYDFGGWPVVALSPDGARMLIGTNDGKNNLYPIWLTTEELIAFAKDCCLVRELTPEEREVFGLPER
jgi:WD40 repeat protein